MTDLTQLLEAAQAGDAEAADRLLPVVYDALRRLAERRMGGEPPGHTLQATALVHEAYLRLVGPDDPGWSSRAQFFSAAAEAMRRILIERARRYRQPKHGGGAKRLELRDDDAAAVPDDVDLLALDDALVRLEQRDPTMAEIVKLRFFAGLTIGQVAETLGVTSRTVNRHWLGARAWLRRELSDAD